MTFAPNSRHISPGYHPHSRRSAFERCARRLAKMSWIPVLGLVFLQGCAGNPMPEGNLAVEVVSEPEGLKLHYRDRTIGQTPMDLRMAGLEETAWLRVESPQDKVLERRIQIIGSEEVRVVFTVADEPGPVAKALGLTDVVVFDYGSRTSFETNKFGLKPEMKSMLAIQAGLLNGQFKGLETYVCGHTDSSGVVEKNRTLSVKRAQAVADYLIESGVDPSRLNVQGFGQDYPLAPNETEEGKALNRRTEIILGDS